MKELIHRIVAKIFVHSFYSNRNGEIKKHTHQMTQKTQIELK